MKQTVYCDCVQCLHYEDKKCTAPELHLKTQHCKTFEYSDRKLQAYKEECRKKGIYPDLPFRPTGLPVH